MIKTSIEKIAEDIGFDIGNSDDITQANLLNGLGRGLTKGCGGRLDMQLCYIHEHLSKEAKIIIRDLGYFIADEAKDT
jgi:hypothetical protein